jgi:hypothetical protein
VLDGVGLKFSLLSSSPLANPVFSHEGPRATMRHRASTLCWTKPALPLFNAFAPFDFGQALLTVRLLYLGFRTPSDSVPV